MLESLIAICLGIGLAASCGLRVFVPLLVISAAAKADFLTLSAGFEWLATWPAFSALTVATVVEIAAYYLPWLDNSLDSIATPIATIAGVSATAACVGEMDPLLKWSVAVIAGGGTAGTVHVSSAVLRLGSTATTGGIGNLFLSTLEWVGSLLLSVLAIFVPILAAVIAIILLSVCIRFGSAILARFRRCEVPERPPSS